MLPYVIDLILIVNNIILNSSRGSITDPVTVKCVRRWDRYRKEISIHGSFGGERGSVGGLSFSVLCRLQESMKETSPPRFVESELSSYWYVLL